MFLKRILSIYFLIYFTAGFFHFSAGSAGELGHWFIGHVVSDSNHSHGSNDHDLPHENAASSKLNNIEKIDLERAAIDFETTNDSSKDHQHAIGINIAAFLSTKVSTNLLSNPNFKKLNVIKILCFYSQNQKSLFRPPIIS